MEFILRQVVERMAFVIELMIPLFTRLQRFLVSAASWRRKKNFDVFNKLIPILESVLTFRLLTPQKASAISHWSPRHLPLSFRSLNVLSVTAARREGRAAQQAYAAKMRCYDELARQNNLELLPMIIESTGRIHPHLINFIDSVLSEKPQGDPVFKGKLRRYWYVHISCSVQRALAESLIACSTRVNAAISSSMLGD